MNLASYKDANAHHRCPPSRVVAECSGPRPRPRPPPLPRRASLPDRPARSAAPAQGAGSRRRRRHNPQAICPIREAYNLPPPCIKVFIESLLGPTLRVRVVGKRRARPCARATGPCQRCARCVWGTLPHRPARVWRRMQTAPPWLGTRFQVDELPVRAACLTDRRGNSFSWAGEECDGGGFRLSVSSTQDPLLPRCLRGVGRPLA